MNYANKIISGVDQLNDYKEKYYNNRVALLTTGSAMDRHSNATLSVVNNLFELTSLFGAEFGVMGERAAGERYSSYQDIWTGLTVFSLYRYGGFHLSREMLASFDLLMIDLPLSGLRYDSYISTIHRLLRQLGETDKKVVILDRANPLGGKVVEGPVLRKGSKLDEDEVSIPIRHGLTLGELALIMNGVDELGADLEVIAVKNWERALTQSDTDRPWGVPQIDYPNFDAGLLASGLTIFEGTNISIGKGTSLPYQVIGAPFLDAIQLAANLNKTYQSGVLFSPIYFTPASGIYQGTKCQGIKINIMQRAKVKPLRVALTILSELKRLGGDDIVFLEYEEDNGNGLLIDHLYGNGRLSRQYAEHNELWREATKEVKKFQEDFQDYLLYE